MGKPEEKTVGSCAGSRGNGIYITRVSERDGSRCNDAVVVCSVWVVVVRRVQESLCLVCFPEGTEKFMGGCKMYSRMDTGTMGFVPVGFCGRQDRVFVNERCRQLRRMRIGMTLGGYKLDVGLYGNHIAFGGENAGNAEGEEEMVCMYEDEGAQMDAKEWEMVSDEPGKRRLYVLDTNVVLHSCQCLFSFGVNDVSVPITVLEELDKFKKGNEELNYNAREFLRTLDNIAASDQEGALAGEGIKLGAQLGNVGICLSTRDDEMETLFFQDSPDHRILATLKRLTVLESVKKVGQRDVILVTKDNNLRVKARAFGLLAQDYITDTVASVEDLYSGRRLVENVPTEAINIFFEDNPTGENRIRLDALVGATGLQTAPLPNESYVLRNCTRSALAAWKHDPRNAEYSFKRIDKKSVCNITPRNSEQTFALNLLLDFNVRLVTISGKAGTGKTLLALAAALESREQYTQV